MTTGALAIFVKTPGLSPVKTRLAASMGAKTAEDFYRHSLCCLEELALSIRDAARGEITVYWAVGEEQGLTHALWDKLPRLWTGPGTLGQRLHHVYSTLLRQYEHVILMGSDSPQLRPERVWQAHEFLSQNKGQVLGPAEDGGYYLFGGRAQLPRELWLHVPYSTHHTCAVFAKALNAHGKLHVLEREFDVDTEADLEKLTSCPMTSPAQRSLMHWLEAMNKQEHQKQDRPLAFLLKA